MRKNFLSHTNKPITFTFWDYSIRQRFSKLQKTFVWAQELFYVKPIYINPPNAFLFLKRPLFSFDNKDK